MSCRSDAASSALTSYAHACTGLAERDVQRTFHELKREGRRLGAPDPTPAEAEAFLLDQESRVRNDPTLTAVRRRSLLTRLHVALDRVRSRVLPTGPTFHAWRHLLSAAWERSRSRIAPGLAAGVLAASLAACGGSRPTVPPVGLPTGQPASPSASASRSVSPSPSPTAVTGPAAAQFGSRLATQGVMEAYKIAAIGLNDQNLLAARTHTIRDYEALKPYLTTYAWNGLSQDVASGDPNSYAKELALSISPGAAFHPSGLAQPIAYENMSAGVGGAQTPHPSLVVRFTTTTVYSGTIVATGKPGTDTLTREWEFVMLPSGIPGVPWQVSQWGSNNTSDSMRTGS